MKKIVIVFIFLFVACKKDTSKNEMKFPKKITENKENNLYRVYFYNKDSLLVNDIKEYYPTGELKEVIPVNKDSIHGERKSFYKDGSLKMVSNYKNDLLNGYVKEFYKDGSSKMVSHYKNNILDGNVREFFENGIIKYQGFYVNNLLEGVETYYLKSGKPAIISNFNRGELCGEQIKYNNDNSIMEVNNYTPCKDLINNKGSKAKDYN